MKQYIFSLFLAILSILSSAAQSYSGTLPVLFINTQCEQSSLDRTNYVDGTYYLDNMGISDYESIGSKDEPLPLQIRGRGNWTWNGFNKKPYKIKLGEKQKLLGMHKARQWALMANADDPYCGLKNTVGYLLSKEMQMPWTPSEEPIEVVWNGQYQGLYMLTENIKIDKKRVNIIEQSDNISYPDSITGGWLMEIDNYRSDTDPCIDIPDQSSTGYEWITVHSPEVLSSAQRSYIEKQVSLLSRAITQQDSSSKDWENVIDADQLARFYVVQEIMDDCESFHGSCYLYKDMGDSEKWHFGPVWDFGNSFYHQGDGKFIYQDPPFGQRWIADLAKFSSFQDAVKPVWKQWKGNEVENLMTAIDNYCNRIKTACAYDVKKWPEYGSADVQRCKERFLQHLNQRISWLTEQWGEGVAGIDDVNADLNADSGYYNLSGQRVNSPQRGHVYIKNHRKVIY